MKYYLDWKDVDKLVYDIFLNIQDNFKPDIVVGIIRGGSIPAVILSHMLNVNCQMFVWQTRDGDIKNLPNIDLSKNILLIDDINDSGLTFEQIMEKWNVENIKTASLIERNTSSFLVDFCGEKLYNDNWVVFPWEVDSEKNG